MNQLLYEKSNSWYVPGTGMFLLVEQNGKVGLTDEKGKWVVPCRYESLDYVTPFRKGFIWAKHSQQIFLYDGIHPHPICSTPDSSIILKYGFYCRKQDYYTIYTTKEEYILNQENEIIGHIDKWKSISFFHCLMEFCRENFRFKNLKELLTYCKQIKEDAITQKEKEEIIIYAYFFLEEILQNYAVQYDLLYTQFSFFDSMSDKEKYWGLCFFQSREIKLSLHLLLTSEDFIREVILHELVHLKHPNHGKDFYKLLHQLSGIAIASLKKRRDSHPFLDFMDCHAIIRERMKALFAARLESTVEEASLPVCRHSA